MILFVRKHFHKNLTRVFALGIACSLVGLGVFTGVGSLFSPPQGGLFSVNGLSVSPQIFGLRTATEKRILEFYQNQLGALAPRTLQSVGLTMSPERNAYNKLVYELALSSCIERSGLHVDVRSIARKAQDPMALMNIFGIALPRSLYDKNGKLEQEILLRVLSSLGMSIDDFEKMLEYEVERDLAQRLLSIATPVSSREIDVQALKKYGTREFEVVTYTLSGYLAKTKSAEVTLDELRAFYEAQNGQNRRYYEPEKRQGIQWKIPVTDAHSAQMNQEVAAILTADQHDFDEFIRTHKGVKSELKEQEFNPKNSHAQMLFRLEVNQKGVYPDEKVLVIVMPTAIKEAVVKEFDAIKKEVERDFLFDKAQKAFVEDLEGPGISDEYKTSTKIVKITAENSKKELDALAQHAIAVSRMENMVVEGSRLRGVSDKGGYIVTLVKAEKPAMLTKDQQDELVSQVMKSNFQLITAASVDTLIKTAKIKGNKFI